MMGKQNIKSKSSFKLKSVLENHTLFIGMAYSFFIFLIIYLFSYPCWESADDFLISGILSGVTGESSPYVLVISYPLSYILYLLQMWFPQLNWLTMVEIFSVWISFSLFIWIFLNKKNVVSYGIAFMMPLVFETLFYTSLNYTRSACLLAFAGLFTLYYCSFEKQSKLGACIGGTLLVLASLIRFGGVFLAIPYVGIWVVKCVRKHIREKQFKKKENITFVLLVLGFSLIILGLNCWHKYEYNKFSMKNNYTEFNSVRAKAFDYLPQDYLSYQMQFEEIGFSYNDYDMLRRSMIYDNFYSEDLYTNIAQINASENNTFGQKCKAVRSRITSWLIYHNSGRQAAQNNLWILLLCSICLAVFCVSEKSIFSLLCTTVGTAIIAVYFIWTGRFPAWIQDSLYFIACINVLYDIDWKAAWLNKVHFRPNVQATRKIAMYIMCVCTVLSGMAFSLNKLLSQGKCSPDIDLCGALSYMEQDDSNIYLIDNFIDCPFPIMDAYGSMRGLKRGSWNNIMRVGTWFIAHPVMNNQLEKLSMTSPISQMMRDNIYLFTNINSENLYRYQTFIYEHNNLVVYPELVKQWGEYAIYSFKVVDDIENNILG